jgi:phthiocerol/phenolphthiocerol synthesis type-I polyketide synthase E
MLTRLRQHQSLSVHVSCGLRRWPGCLVGVRPFVPMLLCEQVGPHLAVAPVGEWMDGRLAALPIAGAQPTAMAEARPGPPRIAGRPVDLVDEIRAMWAETLGLPDITADSDCFAMGGDSLTAVQVVSRLQARFGVELSVAELSDAPTASDLATLIGAKLG